MTAQARVVPAFAQKALVVRLSGALDSAAGPGVTAALQEAVAELPPPTLVVLDLHQVDQLTANSLRTLHTFAESTARKGLHLRVVAPPGSTAEVVLDSAGGDTEGDMELFADLHTALTAGDRDDRDVGLGQAYTQLGELTRTLLDDTTVVDALRHVINATSLAIPSAALVSVTLRDSDGTFYTPVETDDAAAKLDEVQYRTGTGPCVTAAVPDGPPYATSPDLSDEPRWPEFAAAAADLGYRSIVASALLPAAGPGQLTGALNVYSHAPHGLTVRDRHIALLLATHASLALANVRDAELAQLRHVELRRAIESRDIIGQAKGILMHRQGITADEAFQLLRRTSQELNVKLVDIAATLAAQHSRLDPPG